MIGVGEVCRWDAWNAERLRVRVILLWWHALSIHGMGGVARLRSGAEEAEVVACETDNMIYARWICPCSGISCDPVFACSGGVSAS